MLVTIKSLVLYGAYVSGTFNKDKIEISQNKGAIERDYSRQNLQNDARNDLQNTPQNDAPRESFSRSQVDDIKKGYDLLSKASYAEEVDGYYEKAAELKKQACDLGIGKACWYYAFQTNNEEDYALAAQVLSASCFSERKNALSGESCTYLGIMQSQGKFSSDYSEANLYEMGCELNDGWGCYRLARDFLADKNYELAKSLNDKALKILDSQCSENIGSSCYLLGSIYEQPFSDKWLDDNTRENHSKIFFERGCKLRDGDACSSL